MDIKGIASEFRAFVMKGNVVDLAVGVVIGGAFGKVVEAIVASFINPILAVVGLGTGKEAAVGFFTVFQAILTFVAIAAVVFFLIVKPMNVLMARVKRGEVQEPSAIPADIALLTEIRDLLKNGATAPAPVNPLPTVPPLP